MKMKKMGMLLGIFVMGFLVQGTSAYFGCISNWDSAVCFNRGISSLLGNDTKTFNLYQADLSDFGYETERAEIKFTVHNPGNETVGIRYGINGVWYQTVYIEPGATVTIKSNVALPTLNLGGINKVQFRGSDGLDYTLPISGYLAVGWGK
ncbi:MAG: hypothetical protein DRO95_01430 [Candidatus Altiarchaeales archaeon]|nr:MAG: hypothetical protein DRO95_01430 [Candidatus Altiarchaeales archaeon]